MGTDRASYGRLSRLITVGRRRAEKGECRLTLDDIAEHSAGPAWPASCREPRLKSARCAASPTLHAYRDIFGDRCYLLAELHYGVERRAAARRAACGSRAQTRLPLVAAGDVHYHVARAAAAAGRADGDPARHDGRRARRALPAERRAASAAARADLRTIFAALPDALRRTLEIADRCTFSLDELRYEYPEELAPPGETPLAYLRRLTWEGAAERYPDGIPDKVRELLEHELALIESSQYEAYFLTVYDLVRFARDRKASSARGAARRPTRPSAIAWA